MFGFEEGSPMPIGCPLEHVKSDALHFLSLYPSYERGVLWTEGGYGAQPAVYSEAMAIIGNEIAAYEAKRAEQQAEQAEQAAALRGLGDQGPQHLEAPRMMARK